MTAKDKADELCKKMLYQIEWNAQPSTVKGVAKQCALIAVDEILQIKSTTMYPVIEDNMIYGYQDYWEGVKQEIEKL